MLNLVNELVAIGEGYQIEFKVSLDKSIAREACAFANASGGKIIIGVTDAGQLKPLNPDNINRLISQAQDILGKLDPKINIKISHGDRFILIDVPEGQRKPYACPDGFFLRIGSNSQKLTRDEILEMSGWSGAIKFDALDHKTARFDRDFDENAYNQFLQKAQITSSFPPKELLKNLQCMTDDVHFTNAGVLFFTKSVEFLLRQLVFCQIYPEPSYY